MITGTSETLPVINHLSYSSVDTYQSCSLKWHFRYVEKFSEEMIGTAFVFGSAIHGGIERYI